MLSLHKNYVNIIEREGSYFDALVEVEAYIERWDYFKRYKLNIITNYLIVDSEMPNLSISHSMA